MSLRILPFSGFTALARPPVDDEDFDIIEEMLVDDI